MISVILLKCSYIFLVVKALNFISFIYLLSQLFIILLKVMYFHLFM